MKVITQESLIVWLIHSPSAKWFEISQTLFSLVACGMYIGEIYHPYVRASVSFNLVEILLAFLFLADWTIRFIAAHRKWSYVVSFFSIVDIMTILPIFFAVLSGSTIGTSGIFRPFRVLRVLQLFRVIQFFDGFTSNIMESVLTVACLLFASAGVMYGMETGEYAQEQESLNEDMPFHSFVYWVIISLTTTGYGDITPQTDGAKMMMALLILITFVLVPFQSIQLARNASRRGEGIHKTYFPPSPSKHIVICGPGVASPQVLHHTLHSVFRDHLMPSCISKAVVILPQESILATIRRDAQWPLPWDYIKVLIGDATNKVDLEMAGCQHAQACLVVCDMLSSDPMKENGNAILVARACLRNFPNVPVYANVMYENSAYRLMTEGARWALGLSTARSHVFSMQVAGRCSRSLRSLVLESSSKLAFPTCDSLWEHCIHSALRKKYHPLPIKKEEEGSIEVESVPIMDEVLGETFARASQIIHTTLHTTLMGVQDQMGKVYLAPLSTWRIPEHSGQRMLLLISYEKEDDGKERVLEVLNDGGDDGADVVLVLPGARDLPSRHLKNVRVVVCNDPKPSSPITWIPEDPRYVQLWQQMPLVERVVVKSQEDTYAASIAFALAEICKQRKKPIRCEIEIHQTCSLPLLLDEETEWFSCDFLYSLMGLIIFQSPSAHVVSTLVRGRWRIESMKEEYAGVPIGVLRRGKLMDMGCGCDEDEVLLIPEL